jgi:ABC-2 type transporter
LPLALSAIRATSVMPKSGIHPKIVSERLGHSKMGIALDSYSHVLPTKQQEAADATPTRDHGLVSDVQACQAFSR